MANKKLFEDLSLATPTDSDRLAFGREGEDYRNITLLDFKALLFGGSGGPVKQVALEIGGWDMTYTEEGEGGKGVRIESSPGVDVLYSNVRGISSVLILNDAQSGTWDYFTFGSYNGIPPTLTVQKLANNKSSVYMKPTVGSEFTTYTVFNDPNVNRGWVVVNYV